MLSALGSTAGAVLGYVTSFVPKPISDTAAQVSEVALSAVALLAQPKAAAGGGGVVEFRAAKSIAFYEDFKAKTEVPYERAHLLRALRARPRITKACLIEDYLTLLAPTKVTHKIYDKLKSKWGYRQFYRTLDTGSKGLASAFIMHVLLEDSFKASSPLHDKLLSYFQAVHRAKKYPPLQDQLKPMCDALQNGHQFIHSITSSDPSIFLDTLSEVLVLSFYEKSGLTEELTFPNFVSSLADARVKETVTRTLAALGDCPSAPLVPLLGPKQSFFGHNPLVKLSFIFDHLPTVLTKVKTLLKAHIDLQVIHEWLDQMPPLKILTAFDLDPIGLSRKETLKPRMIEIFKEELIKYLTPNCSLFLEGFSFSKRASHISLIETIADEIVSLDGGYLEALTNISIQELYQLARCLEDYEEELTSRQIRFINFLSDQFNLSFVVHSWQISQQDKKRLKIQQIGKWYAQTCHLVLFPENNTSRVDLLKQHGVYASRADLTDLIHSASFKKFKRHGSGTLSAIAEGLNAASAADKLLAKHFIYFRLHIFACLQKLIHSKLPLLKDPERFDQFGAKEDDAAFYNPFGQDHAHLLPEFHSEVEANMFRIEKHISGLNREIAELSYLADCVFSHTKHEEIIAEIQMLLKAAKAATFQFYLKKIPDFIAGFTAIVGTLQTEIEAKFQALKAASDDYNAINAEKIDDFRAVFSRPKAEGITNHEIIPLVPRLNLENNPPDVFSDFSKLKKMIEIFKEAESINGAEVEREIREIALSIKNEKDRFLAFFAGQRALFERLFDEKNPLEITKEELTLLIPKDRIQHQEIQKIISSMNLLQSKVTKLKYKNDHSSDDYRSAIEALRALIITKKELFCHVNPTKEAIFDRIFATPNPWDINKLELMDLKVVPKGATEDAKIYQDLKAFLKLLQKSSGFKKEGAKLAEKYAQIQAVAGEDLREINIYDHDEELFPEAGSLGAHDGDTASLGGASYSSELRSIGSVEKWLSGLLI